MPTVFLTKWFQVPSFQHLYTFHRYHIPILIASACLFNQAPLCVEGWDEALHEIGKQSYETVLSPERAAALLKAVESLPVLVIGGAEDAVVPLKSVQAMASKLVNSVSCFDLFIFMETAFYELSSG